jgi:hypothetical protein
MSALRHISSIPALDLLTEPVKGDARIAGILLAIALIGFVLSTWLDLNPAALRTRTTSRTTNGRLIRGGSRFNMARRRAS